MVIGGKADCLEIGPRRYWCEGVRERLPRAALRGIVQRARVEVKWEEVLEGGGQEGLYLA